MFAGFAIIVAAVVGYWVYASIRMTHRGHEESGLYGERVRRLRRDERQRRRAEHIDAVVARRERLDTLADEARSAAWRGVAIVGIDHIGGWIRISFVDGKAWLLRTDTTSRGVRSLLGGPLVIQRAVRSMRRNLSAGPSDSGCVELTLYSLIHGERQLIALDAALAR